MDRVGVILASMTPLEIIQGANDSSVSSGLENSEFSGGAAEVFRLLHLDNLFYVLRRDLMLIAVCILAVTLLRLMVIRRPKDVADKKMDILHKLIIVFMGASIISILNILFHFFSAIFG